MLQAKRMNRFLFIAISFLSLDAAAQEPADALRYAWIVPGGTARQQAIGGAMGSLGGDISATFTNPAGIALYKTGDLVITPVYRLNSNKANYYNRTEKAKENKFNLGTSGIVAGTGSNYRRVKNVAVSLAFNRTADFNNELLYRGANNQNSYSEKYLEELQNSGVLDSSAAFKFPQGSSLAINTYWVDPVKNGSGQVTGFTTNSPIGNLLQENRVVTTGGMNEFALGVGVNTNDRFFFGGTVGVPFINYNRTVTFTEADASDDFTNNFNYAKVTDNLQTKGAGINLKAGLIYKPAEYLRLGLAFHTPTAYSLKDVYGTNIETDTEGYAGVQKQSSADIDAYTGMSTGETQYLMVTPYRAIASVSYVLREIEDVTKQKGFLTADVEYINYKAASFATDTEVYNDPSLSNYFESLNKAIDNAYKGAFNFKVGGELKFTTIMARLGAALFGSPYKKINGDEQGSKLQLSGGLGYRNKGIFIDLTYVHGIHKDAYYAYRLQNAPYQAAALRSTAANVLLTAGVKF